MVVREFCKMAKKKTNPEDSSVAPAVPRRRAAPKAHTAKKAAGTDSAAASTATASSGNGKTEPTRDEIAEAAYFRHLNRHGAQGDEFRDWIEAERELRSRQSR
jgi:hypothetical protein